MIEKKIERENWKEKIESVYYFTKSNGLALSPFWLHTWHISDLRGKRKKKTYDSIAQWWQILSAERTRIFWIINIWSERIWERWRCVSRGGTRGFHRMATDTPMWTSGRCVGQWGTHHLRTTRANTRSLGRPDVRFFGHTHPSGRMFAFVYFSLPPTQPEWLSLS